MKKNIWSVSHYNLMKCCPADEKMKKEWEQDLKNDINVDENEIIRLCNLFKMLSNPIRLKIAYLLLKQDYCVEAVVQALKKKQNLVSHHLSVMKKNGVVESFKSSRYTYYRLDPEVRAVLEKSKK